MTNIMDNITSATLAHITAEECNPSDVRVHFTHCVQSTASSSSDDLFTPAVVSEPDYLRMLLRNEGFASTRCRVKDARTMQLRDSPLKLGQICKRVYGHTTCTVLKDCVSPVIDNHIKTIDEHLALKYNGDAQLLADQSLAAVNLQGNWLANFRSIGPFGK